MKFGGHGFKSNSGQISLDTSKNPSVVNTIYIFDNYITIFANSFYVFFVRKHGAKHNTKCLVTQGDPFLGRSEATANELG